MSETCFLFGKAQLVPDNVHQIGRILAVVNGKIRAEADLVGIFAQKTCANTMKRTRPFQSVDHDT